MQGPSDVGGAQTPNKNLPKKRTTRLPNAWAPHPRPSRSAATRTPSSPTRAHQRCWRLLDRLFISSSLITTSGIRDTPRNTIVYLGHTFRQLLPHRNVTNQGTANPSRPRRVAALPSQLQPAISPQLLGLEWLTKRYCRC